MKRDDADGMDAAIIDGILKRFPAAVAKVLEFPILGSPTPDGPWTELGTMDADGLKLVPEVDPRDVTWPDRIPVKVTNWDSSTGRMEFTVDDRTAAMIRGGMVSGFSIAADPAQPRDHVSIIRTDPGGWPSVQDPTRIDHAPG